MKSNEIIRDIMKNQNVGLSKLADRMQKSIRLVSDRLRMENISTDKLIEMLRYLDYDLVIMPRGKAGRIDGAYLVDGEDK